MFSLLKEIGSTGSIDINVFLLSAIDIFTDSGFGHMWYLYELFGIYLCLPVIKTFVNYSNKKTIEFILLSLFVFGFFLPTAFSLFKLKVGFHVALAYPILYLLLGYYLSEYQRVINKFVDIILIIIMCTVIISTNLISIETAQALTAYTSPITAIYSCVVFRFIIRDTSFRISEDITYNKIWRLDRKCFSIYLVHPIIIHFVYRFLKITPLKFVNYQIITVIFFLAFAVLSYVAATILYSIKLLKDYIL